MADPFTNYMPCPFQGFLFIFRVESPVLEILEKRFLKRIEIALLMKSFILRYLTRAEMLFWFWLLGAYELFVQWPIRMIALQNTTSIF